MVRATVSKMHTNTCNHTSTIKQTSDNVKGARAFLVSGKVLIERDEFQTLPFKYGLYLLILDMLNQMSVAFRIKKDILNVCFNHFKIIKYRVWRKDITQVELKSFSIQTWRKQNEQKYVF